MGQLNARRVEFDKDGNPACGVPATLFESNDAFNAIIESYKIMSRYSHERTGHVYDPTEYAYERTTISFDDATRTFSQSPRSPYTSFQFFIENEYFSYQTTQSVQIDDVEGLWFFYYDVDGVLQATQSPPSWDKWALTALIYWDATNKKQILLGEERHGLAMSWATHRRLHRVENTRSEAPGLEIVNAILDGDGSLDVHAQYGVNDGFIHDEDIIIPIKNAATPTNPFEQILRPYVQGPVFYLSGGTEIWRRKDATQFPFYYNVGTRPYFNNWNGSTWGVQEVQDGWFFATWAIYSNDLSQPASVILGQREDPDLISAVNNNTRADLVTTKLPSPEIVFFRKLIWEVSNSFTNTPKCRLRYIAEATEINPANDRYQVPFQYIGNAGTGKYLETFVGSSSDESPFGAPENSFIRTITLRTTANSTGTLGIFVLPDLTTPVLTISLSASTYIRQDFAYNLLADDEVAVRVTSGAFSKPTMRMFVQTNL